MVGPCWRAFILWFLLGLSFAAVHKIMLFVFLGRWKPPRAWIFMLSPETNFVSVCGSFSGFFLFFLSFFLFHWWRSNSQIFLQHFTMSVFHLFVSHWGPIWGWESLTSDQVNILEGMLAGYDMITRAQGVMWFGGQLRFSFRVLLHHRTVRRCPSVRSKPIAGRVPTTLRRSISSRIRRQVKIDLGILISTWSAFQGGFIIYSDRGQKHACQEKARVTWRGKPIAHFLSEPYSEMAHRSRAILSFYLLPVCTQPIFTSSWKKMKHRKKNLLSR